MEKKPTFPRAEEEGMALRTLIAVVVASAVVFLISIYALSEIFGNVFVGIYYSLIVLFDAVGYYPTLSITLIETHAYKFFAILFIDGIARVVLVGFAIASVVELVGKINLKYKLHVRAAKKLRDHIIICGYSSFGERLVKDLSRAGQKFVIIEREREKVDMLHDIGYDAIDGDFTRELFLNEASVKRARSVVIDSGSDLEDAVTAIAIKRLNSKAKVIVRVNNVRSLINMMRAGADQCIIPEVLAGEEIGDQILRLRG